MIQRDDVREELRAVVELQALTAAVTYQQFAREHGLHVSWASDRLHELAMVIGREASNALNPQPGSAYTQMLRDLAGNIRPSAATFTQLTLIDGGKRDDQLG